MKVLFISPEVAPIVRAGGLGDVVGALPLELHKAGIDVRVLCPLHRVCKSLKMEKVGRPFLMKFGRVSHTFQFQETRLGESEIQVYLLENGPLFDRSGIYADENGDYSDNALRSFALSKSALQLESTTGWTPQIFHSHDWMAAPLSAYLNRNNQYRNRKINPRSILTIHNLEHQGIYPENTYSLSGLPNSFFGMDGFNHFNSLNLLKGGIQHADKITTVSPSYAKEIRTEEFGCGLEHSLEYRAADLIGILNGIDEKSWNPAIDPALKHKISPTNPHEGKRSNKIELLSDMELPNDETCPLFGSVSRMYNQKGLDLLADVLPGLLKSTNAKFIILGNGDKELENKFKSLATKFPHRITSVIGFDDSLARRIFAGTDFFLMPSRFEPCGLAQQYAMKYGSIPVARKTGGLADTIKNYNNNENSADGLLFEDANSTSLRHVINKAINLYKKYDSFKKVRKNAFLKRSSWDLPAKKYIQVYDWVINSDK